MDSFNNNARLDNRSHVHINLVLILTNLTWGLGVSTYDVLVLYDGVGDDWITFMSSLGINNAFMKEKTQAKREMFG